MHKANDSRFMVRVRGVGNGFPDSSRKRARVGAACNSAGCPPGHNGTPYTCRTIGSSKTKEQEPIRGDSLTRNRLTKAGRFQQKAEPYALSEGSNCAFASGESATLRGTNLCRGATRRGNNRQPSTMEGITCHKATPAGYGSYDSETDRFQHGHSRKQDMCSIRTTVPPRWVSSPRQ